MSEHSLPDEFVYYGEGGSLDRRASPRKETGEIPQFDVHIRFGPHATAEHLTGLHDELTSADVYIPELFGWTDKDLTKLRAVSFGTLTPEQAMQRSSFDPDTDLPPDVTMDDFRQAQYQALYQTHKPVVLVDVPDIHPIRTMSERADVLGYKPQGTFADTLQEVRRTLKEEAKWTKKREEHMLSVLPHAIAEAIEMYPELQAKSKLRALMTLGSAHTGVYHHLKRDRQPDQSITRSLEDKIIASNFKTEGVRRALFGKEISDELAARVYLEHLLEHGTMLYSLQELSGDGAVVEIAASRIAGKFSQSEIESLFNQGTEMAEGRADIAPFFLEALLHGEEESNIPSTLEQKGIPLPTTKPELDEFIKPR